MSQLKDEDRQRIKPFTLVTIHLTHQPGKLFQNSARIVGNTLDSSEKAGIIGVTQGRPADENDSD
jgi:hypothetical protein